MKLSKIHTFADLAAKQGKCFISVPLKDRSSAKVLFNDRGADVFVVKHGKLQSGTYGFRTNEDNWASETGVLLERLQKAAADGVDVDTLFSRAYNKNVK